jgi:hypothetical protein
MCLLVPPNGSHGHIHNISTSHEDAWTNIVPCLCWIRMHQQEPTCTIDETSDFKEATPGNLATRARAIWGSTAHAVLTWFPHRSCPGRKRVTMCSLIPTWSCPISINMVASYSNHSSNLQHPAFSNPPISRQSYQMMGETWKDRRQKRISLERVGPAIQPVCFVLAKHQKQLLPSVSCWQVILTFPPHRVVIRLQHPLVC